MRAVAADRSPLAAPALVGLLLMVAWLAFDPYYLTNDDVAMRLMVEGTLVPGMAPTGFCLFMNVGLGKALATAYRWAPALPWYDLALGAGALAGSMVLLRTWLRLGEALGLLGVLALGLHFILPLFVHCQFSLVAMTLAAAATASVTYSLVWARGEGEARTSRGIAGALFVGASLVRAEAAALVVLMAALLALPLIVVRCRENSSGRPGWQAGLLLGAAAFGTAGLSGVDWLLYAREPGWEDFRESNWLRARLTEYLPSGRVTAGALARLQDEVGWSPNDLRMLREWWVTDRALFSTEKLRRAVATIEAIPGQEAVGRRRQRWSSALRTAGGRLGQVWPSVLLLGALLLRRPSRPGALYLAGSTLVVLGTATVLDLTLKPVPARLFLGMLLLQATFVALSVARWGRRPQPAGAALGTLVLLVTVTWGVVELGRGSALRAAQTAEVRADVVALAESGESVVVLQGAAFPFEAYWRPLRKNPFPFAFVALGVSAQTPPVQQFLAHTGRLDLPLALCREPTLRLVTRKERLPFLSKFLLEHHGLNATFVVAFRGRTFKAFSCRTE